MTQAICDITTVVVEPQADTTVEVANRAGGMEQVFHDNTLIGNGNSVDLGVNTNIIATKEYSDEQDTLLRNEINGKLTAIDSQIDANADAIQKTREDFASADQAIRDDMNAEDGRLQSQITAHATAITTNKNDIDELGDDVSEIQAKIPESASGSNPLITKQQLLDKEMDIRDDMNEEDGRLQTQITAHAAAITVLQNEQTATGNQIQTIESKIPDGTSDTNPLINKQQLLDEEMDIREDLNSGLSELQTQITAQAAEIAGKQDELIAGDNIIISGNIISATGAGGGAGFDVIVVQELPESGEKGIIYLVPKDSAAPDIYDEYVWVTTTSTFELIGSTKVDLTGYVKNTDYAKKDIAGVIKSSPTYGVSITNDGHITAITDILFGYTSVPDSYFIGKGTLENIKEDLVARATENAVNTQNLTVGSGEGALYMGVVAGTATIATNNGLDIAAQTKFDTAPTTDDNTTYANALDTSLVRKAQVATAISDALANVDALPSQSGNEGKVLSTNGSEAEWTEMPGLIIRRL